MNTDAARNRILIVDDTPENLDALIQVLRQEDYVVLAARSGRRALQVAGREAPDLILLDIRMPEMDGYEVCRRLKDTPGLADIPVIFISAATDTDVKVEAFAVGGVDYIEKPFQAGEVLARVRTHLALRRTRMALESARATLEARVEERTRELSEKETRFRNLVEKLPDLVYTRSRDRGFIYTNGRLPDMVGDPAGSTPPQSDWWRDHIHPDDAATVEKAAAEADQGRHFDIDYRVRDASGQWRWIHDRSFDIRRNTDTPVIDGLATDITERKAHQAVIERLAYFDTLTGLANRKRLVQHLDALVAQGRPFALLLMDLDRFKEINDTVGHTVGDGLLIQVARLLSERIDPAAGLVARTSGDEFAICLHDAGPDAARTEAAALLARFEPPFHIGDLRIKIGASVGISVHPSDGASASDLLKRADVAMFAAKQRLGGYACYASDTDQHSAFRLELLSEFTEAIAQGQLELHYQPKVRIADRSLAGFEALVRWNHPRHGLLPPGDFLPLVEVSDAIDRLTRWVIGRAAEQLATWRAAGLTTTIALNLSARNLVDESLAGYVAQVLGRWAVPPDGLEFEITETAMLVDLERTMGMLGRIAEHGIGFALDDFGTGYSSFSLIQTVPHITRLKIDRSFVSRMCANRVSSVVVQSMIALARGLGVPAVAEGVETPETLQALADAGCPEAQGYLFARPMPPDQARRWLLPP